MEIEALEDRALRIRLSGDIDMLFTVANQAVFESLFANPARRLELDTAALTFIDSTGLRVIATIVTQIRASGGDVQTIKSSEAFARLIEVTNLGERFGMVDGAIPEHPGGTS
jgi:anti-anti-sigma factor